MLSQPNDELATRGIQAPFVLSLSKDDNGRKRMSFYVYILKCADGSYYTGHTENLEARLSQHLQALPGLYTSARLPLMLAWSQEFSSREEALASEIQIKGWTRAKKEALIRGDWSELRRLARSRGSTGSPRTDFGASPSHTDSEAGSPRTDSEAGSLRANSSSETSMQDDRLR